MVSHGLILAVKTECHYHTCQALSLAGLILQIAFGVEAASCSGTVQPWHSETKCGCPIAPMAALVLASNDAKDSNAHNRSSGTSLLLQALFVGDLQ